MKFTINWLKEHLSTSADLDTISSTLTNIGLEVESIEDRVDELKPFTVARVKQAVQFWRDLGYSIGETIVADGRTVSVPRIIFKFESD